MRTVSRQAVPLLSIIALSAVVVMAAGCTTVVAGTAAKAGGPAPPAADVALLDPGNYPRRPRAPLGPVANEDAGRRVEALRMADIVAGPWEVDQQLQAGRARRTSAWPKVEMLSDLFGAALQSVAAAHRFLVGFSSDRTSRGAVNVKGLANAVLRFASPADASAAAAELAAADMAIPRAGKPATRLDIPRYPATVAYVGGGARSFEAEAFSAHGTYVLYEFADSDESAEVVADLIAKALDVQGPLVDHFQATPADQIASMPADPTGLLARSLPLTQPDINKDAVFEQRGSMQFRPDPAGTQAMFNDAGVQRVSLGRSSVYEAIDSTGAQRAVDGLIRIDVPFLNFKPTGGINGLPTARFFDRGPADPELSMLRYLCIAPAGRYAIKVTGGQELDVHQAVAAQYLMLTAS